MTPSGKSSGEMETASRSEFGAGIVVCLAKFSEHLSNDWARRIARFQWWSELDDAQRDRKRVEATKYPRGDIARWLLDVEIGNIMEGLSHLIELWANGASDHFYELDDRAPAPLKELAAFTLKIGHGFSGEEWTWDDWQTIWRLWEESCLAVDRQLGVEEPDWGEW